MNRLLQKLRWFTVSKEQLTGRPDKPALYAGLERVAPATETVIARPKPAMRTVKVKPGDSLFSLARQFNTTVQAIVQANHLTNQQAQIVVGQRLLIPMPFSPAVAPAEKPTIYRVQRGETLEAVAHRFKLPAQAIAAENKIAPSTLLLAGQWLIIPAAPEQPVAVAAPPIPPQAGLPAPASPELSPAPSVAKPQPSARTDTRPVAPVAQTQASVHTDTRPVAPVAQTQAPVHTDTRPVAPVAKAQPAGPIPAVASQPAPPPQTPPIAPPVVVAPEPVAYYPRRPIPPEAHRGLYLPHHLLSDQATCAHITRFLQSTGLNTLIIDFKSDWGFLSYPAQTALAADNGANRLAVHTLLPLLSTLKNQRIHTVARVVTFKDNLLAKARPDLAARYPHLAVPWQDAQMSGWVDPFLEEVWAYNLEIAGEAARLDFDEIQFDSLHFPPAEVNGSPQFSQPLNPANRVNAITAFLSAAQGQLRPMGVKLSAVLPGAACERYDDSLIGLKIERAAPYLDALSPVFGPADASPAISHMTARAVARSRAVAPACRIKPWFLDSGHGPAEQLQAQLQAVFNGGGHGFTAWSAQAVYTEEAYQS